MTDDAQLFNYSEKCHDPYLRCALYGAAQVALGIQGCCVLSHSPQGCYQLVSSAFGWQDADYTKTLTLCTKLCEDEIVHGGEDLLSRTILEAKDMSISVMFVITACGPEIVGDDILAVCEEVGERVNFQIVPIQSAGFRGDQNRGIDIALEAVLKRLVTAPERQSVNQSAHHKIPRSVCLVAPSANANPSWTGDLSWAKYILNRMGATVTATLSHDTSLEELDNIPFTEGAILLSHDAGQQAVDDIVKQYAIEQWCKGLPLPIGFTNTKRWLLELGNRLGAEDTAKQLIAEGESRVVTLCRKKGLEQSGLHRTPAAIAADATIGIPLIRFLTEDLEMIPEMVSLRSAQPAACELLSRELADLNLTAKTVLNADVYQTKMSLKDSRPDIVFGSNIERHAIEDLDIPFMIRLVNPISQYRIIDREYFGYTGMLNLIEQIQNQRTDRYRSKHRRYQAKW